MTSESSPGPPGEKDRLEESAQQLIDAISSISSALDTRSVLHRIVATSCELTEARYGALAVVAGDGTITDFVTYGMDERAVRALGHPPTGKGVLSETLRSPIRIDDIGAHPASIGFPENHPPMRTLLGLPIKIRGLLYGNLYLTDKNGGDPFDAHDEVKVQALANVAALVIENAQSFRLSDARRRWLEKFSELTEMLLPPISLAVAFQRIADAVLAASGAQSVNVVQVPPKGPAYVVASCGVADDPTPGEEDDFQQSVRTVVAHGEVLDRPFRDDRIVVMAPLNAHLAQPGVITATFHRSTVTDELEERELLTSFADQAGLALDRAQALEERAEMRVVSDRDRIARDLHDVVIQRLFAAGLHMQTTRSMATDPAMKERLDQSVRDLDQTIRDIRGTIFELQTKPQNSLRIEVRDLTREYIPVLGFTPSVSLSGPVDRPIESQLQQQLVAVIREALSNVARHAEASSASVEVQVTPSQLRLRVTDDGKGLPEIRHESGLGNAKRRAQMLGGTMDLWPGDPSGTVFVWQVPYVQPE